MPRAWVPYPTEEPPGYNPDDPYADKVALSDHRHYKLGQYFILEARARVRAACSENSAYTGGTLMTWWAIAL